MKRASRHFKQEGTTYKNKTSLYRTLVFRIKSKKHVKIFKISCSSKTINYRNTKRRRPEAKAPKIKYFSPASVEYADSLKAAKTYKHKLCINC